jgi:hypothetical protein
MPSNEQVVKTPEQQAEDQAFLARFRALDIDLRAKARARAAELSSSAGGSALKFLLDSSDKDLENTALITDARSKGISDALGTYVSALRHYMTIQDVTLILEGIRGSLVTMRDYQQGEAESLALLEITGHPNQIGDGRNRKLALVTHARCEGSTEFIEMIKVMEKELSLPIRTPALNACSGIN